MIITRSPLRISLGGGGTDLPSYYRNYSGFLISAAIDKYVYVTVMRPFTKGIFLKYSKLEHVDKVDQVKHPIIREALRMMELRTPQIEITTLADIPAGTGLGSSGCFTTALIKALYTHRRRLIHPAELAKAACEIEIDRLPLIIGAQFGLGPGVNYLIGVFNGDKYIAVLGKSMLSGFVAGLAIYKIFEGDYRFESYDNRKVIFFHEMIKDRIERVFGNLITFLSSGRSLIFSPFHQHFHDFMDPSLVGAFQI